MVSGNGVSKSHLYLGGVRRTEIQESSQLDVWFMKEKETRTWTLGRLRCLWAPTLWERRE